MRSRLVTYYSIAALVGASVSLTASSALAQTDGLNGELARAEKVYFGEAKQGLHAEKRLELLEKGIFGKTKDGSLTKRLARIQKAIGSGEGTSDSKRELQRQSMPEGREQETAGNPSAEQSAIGQSSSEPKPPDPSIREIKSGQQEAEKKVSERNVNDHSLTGDGAPATAPRAVKSTRELLQDGARHFRSGDLLKADATFKQVLVSDPKNVDALFNLGALAEGRGELETALGLYQTASELKPQDKELAEATRSLRAQIGTPSTLGPLTGSARLSQPGVFQTPTLNVQQPFLGQSGVLNGSAYSNGALLNTHYSSPPVLQVNEPPPPQMAVSPQSPRHRNARRAIGIGLHAGLNFVPLPAGLGGLRCPLCRIVGGY